MCCYFVGQFTASFEGKLAPVTFNKDIYIGTVPICRKEMKSCIAGMYNQPYKDSTEFLQLGGSKSNSNLSLTHIIAAAVAAELDNNHANPTAPCLSIMERQQDAAPVPVATGLDRPPPYAPGHADESAEEQNTTASSLEQAQAIAEGNVPTSPTAPNWNTLQHGANGR